MNRYKIYRMFKGGNWYKYKYIYTGHNHTLNQDFIWSQKPLFIKNYELIICENYE